MHDPIKLTELRRADDLEVQRRLVAHVAAGRTTDRSCGPMQNPASIYTDPVRFDAEMTALFLNGPIVAGLSCDIPKPGDIAVFDSIGPSIILSRKEDGSIAAFRNMCTHRAARLVDSSRHVESMSCPFHGWTFGLDGQLVAVPGKAGFEGLDATCLSLLSVSVTERHGLIFISPTGQEAIDADAFIGDFAAKLELLDLGALQLVKQGPLFTRGNWKYVLDTFGEGYHFAALHPATLGQTHFSNVAAYDAYSRSFRIVFPQKIYRDLVGKPESGWPPLDSAVYVMFPNVAIVVGSPQPGLMVVQVFRIFPDGVGGTRVELAVYAPAAVVNEQTLPMFEAGYEIAARIVSSEDFSIAAAAFENLRWAPPEFKTVIGSNEIALQNLQAYIAEAVGMPLR